MKILKSSNKEDILYRVKHLLWDREVIKELGEPIVWGDKQEWYLALDNKVLVGFLVVELTDHYKIHYMYVLPEHRRKKIMERLYNEFQAFNFGKLPIKAMATKSSLPYFKKLGYTVTKEFVNYFKVEKQWNN